MSPPARPAPLEPAHLYKAVGLLLLAALLFHFFTPISRILLLAYAAATLAVALNAVVRWVPLQRKWVTALLALAILAGGIAALWFGGSALFAQARSLADRAPLLLQELQVWGEWLRQRTGLDVDRVAEEALRRGREFLLGIDGARVLGQAQTVLELFLFVFAVIVGALFALANPNDRLLTPLLRAVPAESRPAVRRALQLLGARLLGWVRAQLIAMLGVGALATLAFYLIGVPYALLLGVLSGIFEFIPLLGPWLAAIPAVLIAFLDAPIKGLWTALAMLLIQQLESNVITPLAMSAGAKVHPFVTLFALLLFGSLFGFLGVLLAVPLVLLLWTLVQVFWVERTLEAGRDRIRPVVEE